MEAQPPEIGHHKKETVGLRKPETIGLYHTSLHTRKTSGFSWVRGGGRSSATSSSLQTAFCWFLPYRDLLPVSLLFAYVFPGFLIPRRALFVLGNICERFAR